MGGSERTRDLNSVLNGPAARHGTVAQAVAQGFAFEQLGNHVRKTVLRADIVNRNDTGIVQGCRRHGFLFESPQPILISRECAGQNLDGNLSIQPRIPRAVHLSHSTGADTGYYFVGAKLRTWGERHVDGGDYTPGAADSGTGGIGQKGSSGRFAQSQ